MLTDARGCSGVSATVAQAGTASTIPGERFDRASLAVEPWHRAARRARRPSSPRPALDGRASDPQSARARDHRNASGCPTVADLVRREQPAHSVTTMASLVTDAAVRRALELVLASHPQLDPARLTWMSLGSNARRETVLSSDIDSAVSFSDDVTHEEVRAYRAAFGEVDDVLRGGGMVVDDNGAAASMPLFSAHTLRVADRRAGWRSRWRTRA